MIREKDEGKEIVFWKALFSLLFCDDNLLKRKPYCWLMLTSLKRTLPL